MPDEKQLSHAEYVAMRKDQILTDLGRIAPAMIAELRTILEAEENIAKKSRLGPYAAFKSVIDGAHAHLSIRPPFTCTREELEQALLSGGWGIGQDGRERKISIAITMGLQQRKRIVDRHDGRLATVEQAASLED